MRSAGSSNESRFFITRTVLLGTGVFLLSVLVGIVVTFWRGYGGSVFGMPRKVALDLTIQATLGPIWLGTIMFVITLPLIIFLSTIFYFGVKRRSFSLALMPFALFGAYWLWLLKLLADGAFD